MMFGEITEHGFVARESQADAGSNEAVCFTRLIFADDGEGDLAGLEVFQSFAARNQFAMRRKNGRNANDVAGCNAGVAQGELKARQAFAVLSDPLGEENFLRDERHELSGCALPPSTDREKIRVRKLASTRSDVNSFHDKRLRLREQCEPRKAFQRGKNTNCEAVSPCCTGECRRPARPR